ncbi:MAG: dTDP-4-dehydrorhamnose 3,5-epimerase [Lachnospiraceae bacterium]|nr:dTDP-4-dehydrorhamnose 3,5-epimerase [Lachnospiraceae bacterium]
MGFEISELDLKGAFVISNFYAGDNRGGFTKSFEKDIFKEAGIDFYLNETFSSRSMKNVIRGLHFQTNHPQAKLVSVIAGSAWDVIVDLRIGSPTFKQWRAFELSAENHRGIYVPRGFAHGFASLEDGTVMLYQCDGKYDAETDTGVLFNDPEIGIEWPVDEKDAIHSKRDLQFGGLKEYCKNPMKIF